MVHRVEPQTLNSEKIVGTLAKIDELSPFVIQRAISEARSIGGESLAKRVTDPAFILSEPASPAQAHDELQSRIESAWRTVTNTLPGSPTPNIPSGIQVGGQETYLNTVKDQLTLFWTENHVRSGVRFLAGEQLPKLTRALTATTDALLTTAFDTAHKVLSTRSGSPSGGYAIIALGNLGRREWLPFSDTDIWHIWSGDGETMGAPSLVGRYSESNRVFATKLFSVVGELLDRTDVGRFHSRGPSTVEDLKKSWVEEPGPVEIRERRIALNSRVLFSTEGVGEAYMQALANGPLNPNWADHFVSRIIDWKEFENNHAREIEGLHHQKGETHISLNYSPGGFRNIMFLNHIGQLLDPQTPLQKLTTPRGTYYGLRALTTLDESHPFHASESEFNKIVGSFKGIGNLCALQRYRFSEDEGGWDLYTSERAQLIAEQMGLSTQQLGDHITSLISPVISFWENAIHNYKDSGFYKRWGGPEDPENIYGRIYPRKGRHPSRGAISDR